MDERGLDAYPPAGGHGVDSRPDVNGRHFGDFRPPGADSPSADDRGPGPRPGANGHRFDDFRPPAADPLGVDDRGLDARPPAGGRGAGSRSDVNGHHFGDLRPPAADSPGVDERGLDAYPPAGDRGVDPRSGVNGHRFDDFRPPAEGHGPPASRHLGANGHRLGGPRPPAGDHPDTRPPASHRPGARPPAGGPRQGVNGHRLTDGRPSPGPRPTNGHPVDGGPPPAPKRPQVLPSELPTEVIPVIRPGEEPTVRIWPVDEPTEYIHVHAGTLGHRPPPPQDEVPEDDDYYDEDEDEGDPPAPRKQGVGTLVVRAFGELMVTAGVIVLLFVVYEVWITDLLSAQKQGQVTADLDRQWQTEADRERTQRFEFADGEGMAKLYIPALGPDYRFTVVEGTSEKNLEVGPGHYKNTARPGEPGNFAVAGHRVGKGAPFNDLDLLNACDAIVVETREGWFVYRMLPTREDAKDWAAHAQDPRCAGGPGVGKVEPLTGEYAAAVGRRIVTPKQSDVVAPVPGNTSAAVPEDQRLRLLTLTTCHPKFSNAQRMIVHAVLVRQQPKDPADPAALPPELGEGG